MNTDITVSKLLSSIKILQIVVFLFVVSDEKVLKDRQEAVENDEKYSSYALPIDIYSKSPLVYLKW